MNLTSLSSVLNYTCICMVQFTVLVSSMKRTIVFEGRAFFNYCKRMFPHDCPDLYFVHKHAIPGLRGQSMGCTTNQLRIQGLHRTCNPWIAQIHALRVTYACRLIMLYNHTGTQQVFYFSLHELTTCNAKVTCMVFYRTHPNSWIKY